MLGVPGVKRQHNPIACGSRSYRSIDVMAACGKSSWYWSGAKCFRTSCTCMQWWLTNLQNLQAWAVSASICRAYAGYETVCYLSNRQGMRLFVICPTDKVWECLLSVQQTRYGSACFMSKRQGMILCVICSRDKVWYCLLSVQEKRYETVCCLPKR